MRAQIRAFLQSRGLSAQMADDLEAFVLQLVQAASVDPSLAPVDGSIDPIEASLGPAAPSVADRYEDLGPIGKGAWARSDGCATGRSTEPSR